MNKERRQEYKGHQDLRSDFNRALDRYELIEAEANLDDATALIDDIICIAYWLKYSMTYKVISHLEGGPSFCCYLIRVPAGRTIKLYADLTPLAEAALEQNENHKI